MTRAFVTAYADAIETFVASPDEEGRERACELGRAAIRQGLGVLDLSRVHSVVLEEHRNLASAGASAWAFFAEALAPFEMALRGVRDANATLKRFNQALEDRVAERTSELRATERQLREQSAVLRGILDGMADGVLVVDAAARLVLANRAANDLVGVDEDVAKGSSTWCADLAMMQSDERTPIPLHSRPLARALEGILVHDAEMFVRRADTPEGLHLRLSASPLRDDAGSITGAVLVFRDTTARRRAEEAARKAEERLTRAQKLDAVGQLAGGVAHDFNNLLAVILSYANLLLEELPEDGGLARDMSEIQQAATSAASLTRQLLAFSRQQVLQPFALDLNEVVSDLARMLKRTLGAHVELSTATASGLPAVLADRGQVEQVLMNLAVNARDAMPSGGKLVIETRSIAVNDGEPMGRSSLAPGDYVVLSVSDTGTGMDAETQARIFEPFFTTKERGRGTGLGLATVYGIVHQSGGHISVYSELGHGTTFRVYLPIAPARAAARTMRSSSAAARGSETVLLVEDEERVRVVAARVLAAHGYEVLVAATPAEARALATARVGDIQLLVTDIVMPGTSGPDLAKELLAKRPSMRVLFTSGYAPSGVTQGGRLPANAHFIEKPFTADSLRAKVREVLDQDMLG